MTHELLGRDEELNCIDRFLGRPGAATQGLILEGEPGIGKTVLWTSGVERARDSGFRVLVARPAESERDLAFSVLADLLTDVRDELEEIPPPQRRALATALLLEHSAAPVERQAIAFGVLALLRVLACRSSALLIAIDDVQWTDGPSAAVLSFALRRAEGLRVLVTQRHEPHVPSESWLDSVLNSDHLFVGPLSLGALRRLLEARLDATFRRPVLIRIRDQARGNPFFALELARGLKEHRLPLPPDADLPVPRNLQRLLANRLAALPRKTRDALAASAALSEPKLSLIDERALQPALAAGLVVLEGNEIRFTHPLLATAAIQALGPSQRRALHGQLATQVDGVEERARHLALAADRPDAELANVMDGAARHAWHRGAPEAAADLCERALALTPDDDAADKVRRTVDAAEYRRLAGDYEHARELIEAGLSTQPAGEARAKLLLQRVRNADQPVDTQIRLLREALAQTGADKRTEALILVELTSAITDNRQIREAEPYGRRALELAERVGDPVLVARALIEFVLTRLWMGLGLDMALVERALDLDPQCEALPVASRPISLCGLMFMWVGDIERAQTLLTAARAIGYERGDSTLHSVLWYSATCALAADEWEQALEFARVIHEFANETADDSYFLKAFCAEALARSFLGDDEGVRRAVAFADEVDQRRGSTLFVRVPLWALAALELSLERPDAALDAVRRVTASHRGSGLEEPNLYHSFPIHVEAALGCGELAEAEELLSWIEERAVRLDRPWALACGARCRGLLCAARGQETEALEAFERALFQHERLRFPRFELARTLLAHGETLRRFNRKRVAREQIEAADRIFQELGAQLWSAKAKRELARISGRAHHEGLTESERRVADLAALGRSNREIADQLFVTVRTVETHLTSVYAKLQVRSRTELASRWST